MTECCDHHHNPQDAPHRLQVNDLCVSYGAVVALCDVNFETSCGHSLALLGPNGAGKSTLIRTLAGLQRRDQGSILWREKPLVGSSLEIAYLPQLDKHREGFPVTVRDVVTMGRLPHVGVWRSMRKIDEERVDEALERMNLGALAGRQIDALSGGQRQRAFLARALAQEAHILMLDEPFTGLDAESCEELAAILQELARRGHLVMASHHELGSVERIFDQAIVLKKKQIAFGAAGEVMNRSDVRAVLGLEGAGNNA
ncbi:MAG: ABC transporter ATP-binding protein [Verrucomicrobiota bacterium JB023]|nr:ABC transporter ATP-binding protein [Verrucomicrobiota bacterium JB023]